MSERTFEIESTGKSSNRCTEDMRDAARYDRRRFMKVCAATTGVALVGNLTGGAIAKEEQPDHLVRFGPTDLYVTRYCQGTAFRRVHRTDNPDARRILHKCIDVGINFFDSAEAYGWGGSEEVLGKVIAGQRDKVIICTKAAPSLPPI